MEVYNMKLYLVFSVVRKEGDFLPHVGWQWLHSGLNYIIFEFFIVKQSCFFMKYFIKD